MAQVDLYKELLKQVQCNTIPTVGFTQDDLDQVKSCIQNAPPIDAPDIDVQIPQTEPTCVPDATEQAKKIIIKEQQKLPMAIRAGIVKGKVEELRDNLKIVRHYYRAREAFFKSTINVVEPFTTEFLYWAGEYDRLRNIFLDRYSGDLNLTLGQMLDTPSNYRIYKIIQNQSDNKLRILGSLKPDYSNLQEINSNLDIKLSQSTVLFILNELKQVKKTSGQNFLDAVIIAIAYLNRELARDKSIKAQHSQIDKFLPLTGTAKSINREMQIAVSKVSHQLLTTFKDNEYDTPVDIFETLEERYPKPKVPLRTLGFSYRQIDLYSTPSQMPIVHDDGSAEQVSENVAIAGSPLLTKPVFNSLSAISIFNIGYQHDNPDADYLIMKGLLYNGIPGNPYPGYYNKKMHPLTLMFTPEERGLTVDSNKVDPSILSVKDAPRSITENDITLYIQNQETYQNFYKTLEAEYPKREDLEYTKIYPEAISPYTDQLTLLAEREVSDTFRRISDSPLKLARPSNYKASPSSAVYTSGTIKFDKADKTLSTMFLYYTKVADEIDTRIAECEEQIKRLAKIIKDNSMEESLITKQIQDIECFKKFLKPADTEPSCEAKAMEKLGSDPLYLHTIGSTNGGLPDFTTQCYWTQFIKSLNAVTLMPFPDLTGPPPANTVFRYWPITCFIPAGPAIVLLPIPPVWKKLFVMSTPLGTLIGLLTMPIAPVGIPLPSIYIIYLAPDGAKYMPVASNIPLLYSTPKNIQIGFEFDNGAESINPLGLHPSNPYKGTAVKGAFTITLAQQASLGKAARLAGLAADVASGKIKTPVLDAPLDQPIHLSQPERMLKMANSFSSGEITAKVKKLKANMNSQFVKLGEMETNKVGALKQKLMKTRDNAIESAQKQKNLAKKRLDKIAAGKLDPNELDQKIKAVVDSFDAYFDNIKFGKITYPSDVTKLNPSLPSPTLPLFNLAETAALGNFKLPLKFKTINYHLKISIRKGMTGLPSKKYNIKKPSDFAKFKEDMKTMADNAIGYLKGDSIKIDTSGAKNSDQALKMAKAQKDSQKFITKRLSVTSLAIAQLPQLQLFNMGRKCCETNNDMSIKILPPELAAAMAIIASLFHAAIDGIKPADILKIYGSNVNQISSDYIPTLLETLVTSIPEVPLPDLANPLQISGKLSVPLLSGITIPSALNPLHPPIIPIVIPLDPILKPLIKAAIAALLEAIFRLMKRAKDQANNLVKSKAGSNSGTNTAQQSSIETQAALNQILTEACGDGSFVTLTIPNQVQTGSTGSTATANAIAGGSTLTVTLKNGKKITLPKIPAISLDIIAYFHLLTSGDIISMVKQIANSVFEQVIEPIASILDTLNSIAKPLNTFHYNIIEDGIPLLKIVKLIKMQIDSMIPQSIKTKIFTKELIALLEASIIPALAAIEPGIKNVAWLGVLALCSLATPSSAYKMISVARLFHPVMNQDDLPPWERLTHKNPLFSIFLDEIAWRGSIYSTGSLIWQTKTPAVLPYTPAFPIVHVSPHLAG